MNERRDVTHETLEGFIAEMQRMILDGWIVSEDAPGEAMMFGAGFTVSMIRTNTSVNDFKARAEDIQARPKLTPQERMAHARAQRGKGKLDLSSVVEQ